jgi:fructose transport system substrate-binding protein
MTGSTGIRTHMGRLSPIVAAAAITLLATNGAVAQSPSAPALDGTGVTIVLITKDNTNPFFVKMHEGAQAEADRIGATLTYAAGTSSADVDGQIAAIEDAVSKGAKGILITASGDAVVPALKAAEAAGLLVIALDTPLNPPDAAQATFATDNFEAGTLIGQWAAGTLGAAAATAKIALIDDSATHASVDVQRDQGFLKGFGVDVVDPTVIGDETDPRIVGHDVSNGQEAGGLTAMENLWSKDPGITVVHTINEPTAAGAYTALKNAEAETKVLMVSVDGGCKGVEAVQAGQLGATAMQFPLLMAQDGVDAVVKYASTQTVPPVSEGLTFFNTGVQLITDKPVAGVPSMDTTWGLANCWGDK